MNEFLVSSRTPDLTALRGSSGDDVFSWASTDTAITTHTGGLGADTLFLRSGNLDNRTSVTLTLDGVEAIDLRNANANTLTLRAADVLQADSDTLLILTDASGDSVDVSGQAYAAAAQGATVTLGGTTYTVDANNQIDLAPGSATDLYNVYTSTTGGTSYLVIDNSVTPVL